MSGYVKLKPHIERSALGAPYWSCRGRVGKHSWEINAALSPVEAYWSWFRSISVLAREHP